VTFVHVERSAISDGYVGLTFDDGPNPRTTMALLHALTSAGLRATMFNIGQNAERHPELVQAQLSAGMWIANHSWTHPHLTTLPVSGMTAELTRTQRVLEEITGTAPELFRPPYGDTNPTLGSVVARVGLAEILWDVDPADWNDTGTADIVSTAGRLTAGQVMLMHDFPPNTIAAVPGIAAVLASRNLRTGMICPSTGRAVAPA
jgi:endo-1,4-beta-xylanase